MSLPDRLSGAAHWSMSRFLARASLCLQTPPGLRLAAGGLGRLLSSGYPKPTPHSFPGPTYSSLSAQRRLVRAPFRDSVLVSSVYRLSASGRGIPSHSRRSTTITAALHECPARSRTRQSSFSSLELLRITCAGHRPAHTHPPHGTESLPAGDTGIQPSTCQ